MPTALIAEEDMDTVLPLAKVFREEGYATETAQDLLQVREILLKSMPDVALLADRFNAETTLDILEELDMGQVIEIYLMAENPSADECSRAMGYGVRQYLEKPVAPDTIQEILRGLEIDVGTARQDEDIDKTARGLIVGESRPMERLYRMIRKCAPTNASVLIAGESGTGKELVARTIHTLSSREQDKLVTVNCSAIPDDLMESQLFGHKKGSFTGATANHRGFFVQANRGTLFLDEITEMDVALQAKMLRVLESGHVRPIGSEKDDKTDVRIIAATNQDPQQAVTDGRLREDLYYRLAQFPIVVPPLRERDDDVLVLAEHFLKLQNEATGREKSFSEDVLEAIRLHDWPGNVRELRNAVIHGHLLAGMEIELGDLPEGLPSNMPRTGKYVRTLVGTPLAEVERRHILATLAHFDDDKKRAAQSLGISLKTLYNRLKQYESE
jgi:DNA-binding NtrC family response regulator